MNNKAFVFENYQLFLNFFYLVLNINEKKKRTNKQKNNFEKEEIFKNYRWKNIIQR